jgi:hypothetical protein
MTYTIQSAKYANAENTSAVMQTTEAGAVLVSEVDTPTQWTALLAWGTPEAYEAPAPTARVATARQFKAALAIAGVISEAEVTSPNLPAVAEPVVAQFPQEQRIVARSTWANMTTVPEDDPLLEAMRLAAGMTEAEKTALFDLAMSIT